MAEYFKLCKQFSSVRQCNITYAGFSLIFQFLIESIHFLSSLAFYRNCMSAFVNNSLFQRLCKVTLCMHKCLIYLFQRLTGKILNIYV